MATNRLILTVLLIFWTTFNACSQANTSTQPATVFVGSTPGDSFIRPLLNIPDKITIDFIRWDLALQNKENKANTFTLNIMFGEGQPNTLGFKGGGEKRSFKGKYTVFENKDGMLNGEVYQLKTDNSRTAISFIKLNDNLLHLLTPDNKLAVGNGGWSYTLNRKEPQVHISSGLPSLTTCPSLLKDTARQIIYEGRTPCLDLARDYHFRVSNDCIKLKWKFILHRDATTFQPTIYTLDWTLSRSQTIQGKWKIINGLGPNSNVILYQLDPDKPNMTLSFLVGDKNVLFFLNKENQLFVGDSNFSFTLNRRQQ